jgi:hypothetical protein
MATIGNTLPTIVDVQGRTDDSGAKRIAEVVEVLSQANEMLDDMVWVECNDGASHKTTIRTGLPSGTWRRYNQGVPNVKTTTAPISETTGMLQAYSQVDVDLANKNGNAAAFRESEDNGIIEGLSQQMAQTVLYGSIATTPESFMGLSARFSTVNTSTTPSAANVIDAGGTGTDNTSIWLVGWGERTIHGIYPSGSRGGLDVRDLGEDRVYDSNSLPYQAYITMFKWDAGIAVRDWRYVVRVANIDVSDLSTTTPADLVKAMTRAYHKTCSTRTTTTCTCLAPKWKARTCWPSAISRFAPSTRSSTPKRASPDAGPLQERHQRCFSTNRRSSRMLRRSRRAPHPRTSTTRRSRAPISATSATGCFSCSTRP